MKTAQEALQESLRNREKIDTQEYNSITAHIAQAIADGKTDVRIDGTISKKSTDRLRKLDYSVTFKEPSDKDNYVNIGWAGANYPVDLSHIHKVKEPNN